MTDGSLAIEPESTGMSPALRVIAEADGASRGNPGLASYGAILYAADTRQVLAHEGRRIGTETNNVAEYHALLAGLRLARKAAATHVTIRMDSKLVIMQTSGRWRVKSEALEPLHAQAVRLCNHFADVDLQWVRRSQNADADALANLALDGHPEQWRPPAPVVISQREPTVQARPRPAFGPRNETPTTVRVEQTATLAAELGLWQAYPDEGAAAALCGLAPDRLAAVWDRLPSPRSLSQQIAKHPLAWKRIGAPLTEVGQ